jgi:hypothetical protein
MKRIPGVSNPGIRPSKCQIPAGMRLRRASQIEADARGFGNCEKDARTQLAVVKGKQREVLRILKSVSAAAERS